MIILILCFLAAMLVLFLAGPWRLFKIAAAIAAAWLLAVAEWCCLQEEAENERRRRYKHYRARFSNMMEPN